MSKKLIKLINNERMNCTIKSQKAVDDNAECKIDSVDTCVYVDNAGCTTEAWDVCDRDFTACASGQTDYT